jgi:hypothetical protein
MHHGCVRSRQRRRGGSGGVVADIANLTVGREAYYTWGLATDHEQYLSGHGESPGRWYGAGANVCPARTPWNWGDSVCFHLNLIKNKDLAQSWSSLCANGKQLVRQADVPTSPGELA